jgi:hypothetical protein
MLAKVVLATEPAAMPGGIVPGDDRLRQLVLDPAYQLK